MTAVTCDRCLSGNHRCLTSTCACSCRRTRASSTTSKPSPTRVARAALPARPRPQPVRITGSATGRPGRPRVHSGQTERERRAQSARSARARDIDRPSAVAEIAADPTGRSWSTSARRLFVVECDRLALVMTG